MTLEVAIAELTEAVKENSARLDRVIAGQEAAMAKLEGSTAKTTRTPRAKKEEPEAGNSAGASTEPVATASEAAAATTASEPVAEKVYTPDDLKAAAMEWRNTTEDEAARQKQNDFFMSVASHLGFTKMTGPEGLSDSDDIKQAIFFIKRAAAGLKVDFNADYDFDGNPTQEVAAPAAAPASDDPFAD